MSEQESDAPPRVDPDTLVGDIRDWLLGRLRTQKKPWEKLSETEQRDQIYAATEAARSLVRVTVEAVAGHGFAKVGVTVGKFSVKDGLIKAEFACGATEANLLSVHSTQGQRAVLVLADPEVFSGEKSPQAPEPDQPALPIEGDEEREAA